MVFWEDVYVAVAVCITPPCGCWSVDILQSQRKLYLDLKWIDHYLTIYEDGIRVGHDMILYLIISLLICISLLINSP